MDWLVHCGGEMLCAGMSHPHYAPSPNERPAPRDDWLVIAEKGGPFKQFGPVSPSDTRIGTARHEGEGPNAPAE